MKRLIYKCLRVLVVSVGVVVIGGTAVHGQNTVEKQKSEFEKGNRDSEFLKGYADTLKAKVEAEELGKVLDCYLMSLPFEQRYTGENVKDFVAYVNEVDAEVLLDVVENWSKLPLNDEQKKVITKKIDQMCPAAVLTWIAGKEKNPDLKMPDFTLLQRSLSGSTVPVGNSKRVLVDMWQSYCQKDVSGIIDEMKSMFSSPLEFNDMLDWLMFSYIGNYLLDECDLSQCQEVISVMTRALEDFGKNGEMPTVAKLKEDFVGKSMMLEIGEE